MSLPAHIAIPHGYRLLSIGTIKRSTDLEFGIHYPDRKVVGEIGVWEPILLYTANDPVDLRDGPIIRPTATTLKRARQALNRAAKGPAIPEGYGVLLNETIKRGDKTSDGMAWRPVKAHEIGWLCYAPHFVNRVFIRRGLGDQS